MIITRTPLRISLLGGGTDIPSFYEAEPGCVFNFSINRYVYLCLNNIFESDGYFLKYSDIEKCNDVLEIKHRIIKSIFSQYGINGVELMSSADYPGGTGMGSSGAFSVGMHRLCNEYLNNDLTNYEYADLACKTEIEKLGEPIGKQDQFGCAIGGAKFIEFESDGEVNVNEINLSNEHESSIKKNFFLVRIPGTRSASKILADQFNNLKSDIDKTNTLRHMASQAREFNLDIENNFNNIGEYLHEAWIAKKSLSNHISNEAVDNIYAQGLKAGAVGGKILGAGKSGFLLLYCPENKHEEFLASMDSYQIEKIELDKKGSVTLHNDSYN